LAFFHAGIFEYICNGAKGIPKQTASSEFLLHWAKKNIDAVLSRRSYVKHYEIIELAFKNRRLKKAWTRLTYKTALFDRI
jgi:hypothetical protein